jgi:hypothetical protein
MANLVDPGFFSSLPSLQVLKDPLISVDNDPLKLQKCSFYITFFYMCFILIYFLTYNFLDVIF